MWSSSSRSHPFSFPPLAGHSKEFSHGWTQNHTDKGSKSYERHLKNSLPLFSCFAFFRVNPCSSVAKALRSFSTIVSRYLYHSMQETEGKARDANLIVFTSLFELSSSSVFSVPLCFSLLILSACNLRSSAILFNLWFHRVEKKLAKLVKFPVL